MKDNEHRRQGTNVPPRQTRRRLGGYRAVAGMLTGLIALLAVTGCVSDGQRAGSCGRGLSPDARAACLCAAPGVVSFEISDMGCPNCAKELTEVLRGVSGVTDAKVCFEEKRAFVTLDKDHPATMEAIQAAVRKRQDEHSGLANDPDCLKPKG